MGALMEVISAGEALEETGKVATVVSMPFDSYL